MQVSRYARKGLFAIAMIGAALASAPAFATYCNNGATNYPKCDNNTPPPTTPTTPGNNTNTNTNNANGGAGGNANAGAAAGALAGANAQTGAISNTNTANGGQGGQGGKGGEGGTGVGIGVGGAGGSSNATGGTSNATGGKATGGNASQGQGQQMGQGQGQSSTNTLGQNTAQNASTQSGVQGAGNSTNGIGIDLSDKSSSTYVREGDRTLFIPPVVPATPPSSVAAANVIQNTSACGPLQSITKRQVIGVFFGALGGQDEVKQGFTDELQPYRDEQGNVVEYIVRPSFYGDRKVFGHQVTQYTAVIGISGARNFAIGGGGGTSQNWGQGGMGSSSANQQMVTTIQLRLCEIGILKAERVEPAVLALPVIKAVRE